MSSAAESAVIAYINGLRLSREKAYARDFFRWWRSGESGGAPADPHGMSAKRCYEIRSDMWAHWVGPREVSAG